MARYTRWHTCTAAREQGTRAAASNKPPAGVARTRSQVHHQRPCSRAAAALSNFDATRSQRARARRAASVYAHARTRTFGRQEATPTALGSPLRSINRAHSTPIITAAINQRTRLRALPMQLARNAVVHAGRIARANGPALNTSRALCKKACLALVVSKQVQVQCCRDGDANAFTSGPVRAQAAPRRQCLLAILQHGEHACSSWHAVSRHTAQHSTLQGGAFAAHAKPKPQNTTTPPVGDAPQTDGCRHRQRHSKGSSMQPPAQAIRWGACCARQTVPAPLPAKPTLFVCALQCVARSSTRMPLAPLKQPAAAAAAAVSAG